MGGVGEISSGHLVVFPFDPTLKTELLTDASKLYGLGCALVHWDVASCRGQDMNGSLSFMCVD